MIIEVLKLLRLNFQILDQKKLDPIKKKTPIHVRRHMYRPIIPASMSVFSHNFYNWISCKIETNFYRFCC